MRTSMRAESKERCEDGAVYSIFPTYRKTFEPFSWNSRVCKPRHATGLQTSRFDRFYALLFVYNRGVLVP